MVVLEREVRDPSRGLPTGTGAFQGVPERRQLFAREGVGDGQNTPQDLVEPFNVVVPYCAP